MPNVKLRGLHDYFMIVHLLELMSNVLMVIETIQTKGFSQVLNWVECPKVAASKYFNLCRHHWINNLLYFLMPHSSSIIIVDGEDEKPIPNPLPLPDIELGIKKQQMSPKQHAKLISRVANIMFGYKRYPTKDEYIKVAKEELQRWSFLENTLCSSSTVSHSFNTFIYFINASC